MGISVLLPVVIILAVTIAIVFCFIGIIMNWWSIIPGKAESVFIYPDSYIKEESNSKIVHIHIKSNIKPQLFIKAVKVGVKTFYYDSMNVEKVEQGEAKKIEGRGIALTPGTIAWITVNIGNYNPPALAGTTVEVDIITEEGFIYKGTARIIG